ncbi:MAG: hypothetical protein J7M09_03170, partial [Deltaproteobacteria bacterium]|nr:hypothetical protein [Candidatus Tharpella sp.]
GFGGDGADRINLTEDMVAVAMKYGVRVFGPNCQGVMNSDPEVRAYCNFTFTSMVEAQSQLWLSRAGLVR